MNSAQFHNALRVMRNIGENSLREFGVIDENWGEPEASDRDQLGDFFRDPYAEAIRMPDANFERLFALIESRQRVAAPKVRYAFAHSHPADRASLPKALYDLGDVRLAWVNEGDLNTLGEEVSP